MLLRVVRAVLVVGLVALASGVPHAVLAAVDVDDCAMACDCEFGTNHCPPSCTKGACAKSIFSAADRQAAFAAPHSASTRAPCLGAAAPVLPLVARGVFHPPKH